MSEVQAWHAQGIIEYVGEVADVRPYLDACHVYVLPSHLEGLPRSILEAMATGRPIITTNSPGCRETVRVGENGFLVEFGKVDELVERLTWLLHNRAQWDRLGSRSRELAESLFDVRKVNETMLRHLVGSH